MKVTGIFIPSIFITLAVYVCA